MNPLPLMASAILRTGGTRPRSAMISVIIKRPVLYSLPLSVSGPWSRWRFVSCPELRCRRKSLQDFRFRLCHTQPIRNGLVFHPPELPDSLLPLATEQVVMSLDENIQFLTEQRLTFAVVQANSRKVVNSRQQQVRAVREELSHTRERTRILRQTLVSDGRLPSAAAIHARIELEQSTKRDQEGREQFETLLAALGELAQRWRVLQESLAALPKDDVTEADRSKISAWTVSLRSQLAQYGFGSFNVSQALISSDTYRPEHEGFDLQTSISASDLIRTIWSYLSGLLELSRTTRTNHPGCIIFDEPRQQSTRDVSFAELLKRASTSGQSGQQVIFFTSENQDRLKTHLTGLTHTFNPIEGRVIKKL
jgi:hypothetical protein